MEVGQYFLEFLREGLVMVKIFYISDEPRKCRKSFRYNTADDSIYVIQEFETAEVLTIYPVKDCNEEMTTRDKTSSRRHSI